MKGVGDQERRLFFLQTTAKRDAYVFLKEIKLLKVIGITRRMRIGAVVVNGKDVIQCKYEHQLR